MFSGRSARTANERFFFIQQNVNFSDALDERAHLSPRKIPSSLTPPWHEEDGEAQRLAERSTCVSPTMQSLPCS